MVGHLRVCLRYSARARKKEAVRRGYWAAPLNSTPDAAEIAHRAKAIAMTPAAIIELIWHVLFDNGPEMLSQPYFSEVGHEVTREERCAFFPPGCGACEHAEK